MHKYITITLWVLVWSCTSPTPPDPILPLPSARQLAWQELEFYAFVHFNMNTFSNMEWGFGDEKPEQFNPTQLDCRQWARVCKEAGMKGIILTTKHHDGFCLWPSEYTDHSVKYSPWKNGKGDVVKELADACKEYGLKFGVYLSPWDRNHPDYGQPEYITYFRNQLKELLTNYGEVFEVWFDGANGGTGYYGGANEERRVDKLSYYDWEDTYAMIRELQPKAVIFSDAGPDVRWIGNEYGQAYPTTWSMLMRDSVYPGMPEYAAKYARGQENGTHWVPAETNVSIRPGWYYHEYEDHKVKSLPRLLDIYYQSIGRNTSFLLNFPVDKRGLIHEKDVEQVLKLGKKIKEDFANELAEGKTASASNERGKGYEAGKALDGNKDTYWATADGIKSATLTIDFEQPTTFNRVLLQEYIPLGQRIKAFALEAKNGDGWQEFATQTTVGYKRILRFPDITTTALRINIKASRACPTLSNIEVFQAPKLLVPPAITRNKAGEITLSVPEEGVDIYYTIDGSTPTDNSTKYKTRFFNKNPIVIQAFAVVGTQKSEISRLELDIAPEKWSVLHPDTNAFHIIDGDEKTWWSPGDNTNEIVIDLGETLEIQGFSYVPMQDRWIKGIIQEYAFFTSLDNKNWRRVVQGEMDNIFNNPTLRRFTFAKTKARYIKLTALKTTDGNPPAVAEIGVLTSR